MNAIVRIIAIIFFYLFMKALEDDANAFCEKAKKYELLLVPGDSFGYPGYVRISYCVSTAMIEKSLPSFEKLAKEYKVTLLRIFST